ncbi:hypothetical protein [Flavobacterium sp. FlaQc-47]|uniref:hypothetical protein n=1 Tax=Flavobacterium sp. FlaQc-47 TaxID=3374180 RepID=UPI003756692F
MASPNPVAETLEGVISLINQLPNLNYSSVFMPTINIPNYGEGQEAYDLLKADFDKLDFSNFTQNSGLTQEITKQKKELDALEKKHTDLVSIFGEDGGAGKGTLTRKLIENIEEQVSSLIEKRNDLLKVITDAELDSKTKITAINIKVSEADSKAANDIETALTTASGKVRIIEQFSDFLAETNKNMNIYFWVLFFLVAGAAFTVAYSVPDLLKCFTSYDTFITNLGAKATSWQIINFAFGLLIVKLPWALCLSAVFTGMYALIKGVLITYEKINQDKRNISAIYAVSGNIAEALNEYGLSIASYEEDDDTGRMVTVLSAPNKAIKQKRESLKWNQIMNYFEGMQHHKNEEVVQDDPSKLKMVSDLLNKVIDKIPAK